MTQLEISKEIFGHAVMYYCALKARSIGVDNALVDWVLAHGAVIDIENGGDNNWRKTGYNLIWNALPAVVG